MPRRRARPRVRMRPGRRQVAHREGGAAARRAMPTAALGRRDPRDVAKVKSSRGAAAGAAVRVVVTGCETSATAVGEVTRGRRMRSQMGCRLGLTKKDGLRHRRMGARVARRPRLLTLCQHLKTKTRMIRVLTRLSQGPAAVNTSRTIMARADGIGPV
jgi:hypothetical protein